MAPASRCLAVAHRGLSSEVTENTLAAFQAAATAGFQGIELDVRVTHDHELVALHDAGIERTTHGNGRVADLNYDELRAAQTPHGPIPRLDDVFSAMRNWKGLWNLEVKAVAATPALTHLVQHHDLMERSLVSSFDPAALAIAQAEAPDIPRGLIVAGPLDDEDLRAIRELDCTWVNVEATQLDEATVRRLQGHGLRVGAWTVNDPARARQLAAFGIDCVITDVRTVQAALGRP